MCDTSEIMTHEKRKKGFPRQFLKCQREKERGLLSVALCNHIRGDTGDVSLPHSRADFRIRLLQASLYIWIVVHN